MHAPRTNTHVESIELLMKLPYAPGSLCVWLSSSTSLIHQQPLVIWHFCLFEELTVSKGFNFGADHPSTLTMSMNFKNVDTTLALADQYEVLKDHNVILTGSCAILYNICPRLPKGRDADGNYSITYTALLWLFLRAAVLAPDANAAVFRAIVHPNKLGKIFLALLDAGLSQRISSPGRLAREIERTFRHLCSDGIIPDAFIISREDWYIVQVDPPTTTDPTPTTAPPAVLPQIATYLTYEHLMGEDRCLRNCCMLEAALSPRILLRHRGPAGCWKQLFEALSPYLFNKFPTTFVTEATATQVAAEYGSVISSVSIPVQFLRYVTGINAIKAMVDALSGESVLNTTNVQDAIQHGDMICKIITRDEPDADAWHLVSRLIMCTLDESETSLRTLQSTEAKLAHLKEVINTQEFTSIDTSHDRLNFVIDMLDKESLGMNTSGGSEGTDPCLIGYNKVYESQLRVYVRSSAFMAKASVIKVCSITTITPIVSSEQSSPHESLSSFMP